MFPIGKKVSHPEMTSILENMKILLSASKFSNTETVGDKNDIGNNQFFTLKKSRT